MQSPRRQFVSIYCTHLWIHILAAEMTTNNDDNWHYVVISRTWLNLICCWIKTEAQNIAIYLQLTNHHSHMFMQNWFCTNFRSCDQLTDQCKIFIYHFEVERNSFYGMWIMPPRFQWSIIFRWSQKASTNKSKSAA